MPGTPCARDSDCDDDDPCTVDEYCDDSTRLCTWELLDGDYDGHPPPVCGGDDCDDDDDYVFPGSPELCDGLDNDCDGDVDEGNDPDLDCGEGARCEMVASDPIPHCVCSDSSRTLCYGYGCFDLQTAHDHCGDCYVACPADASCVGGECVCPGGLTACEDRCVDTQTDTSACGGCYRPCSGTCAGGVCSP